MSYHDRVKKHNECGECKNQLCHLDTAYSVPSGGYICENCITNYQDEHFDLKEARNFIKKHHCKQAEKWADTPLRLFTEIDIRMFLQDSDLLNECLDIEKTKVCSFDEV